MRQTGETVALRAAQKRKDALGGRSDAAADMGFAQVPRRRNGRSAGLRCAMHEGLVSGTKRHFAALAPMTALGWEYSLDCQASL